MITRKFWKDIIMREFKTTKRTANGKLAVVDQSYSMEEINNFIGSGAVCKHEYNGTKLGCPRTKGHTGPHLVASLHRVIKIWED